ncbi:MAG: molybdopterin biosynthesis protein [Candidatus Methanomethylicia archaeon]
MLNSSSERKLFHVLTSIGEVEGELVKHLCLKPLGIEDVDLENALGRILAEDIYAPIDYPSFDRAEVDGYAVRAEDTYGVDEEHPVRLRVTGVIGVGEAAGGEVNSGEAIEVATGAIIPRGANSVVMEEYTQRIDGEILVYRAVYPGENIATTASDISMGDLILRKGILLKPHDIGLIASLGIGSIKVYRKVKVAIFSTGSEVVKPGLKTSLGQVYDVNSYILLSSLKELGVEVRYAGHLPDNYGEVRRKIEEILKYSDVVITSGGTSAGLGDLIYRVFDDIGEPGVIIHGLKVKPGKPTVIAVAKGKLLIGMPGFPMSCTMVFHKVVKPIIAKLQGLRLASEETVKAKIPYRLRVGGGKAWLIPVSIIKSTQELLCYPLSLSSGSVSALSYADGYLHVPENKEILEEYELVDIHLFSSKLRIAQLVFIGSHDIALSRILGYWGLIDECKIIPTGSLRGWYAVINGEADIAPTHLLHEETEEYNTPYLEKLKAKDVAVLVRGYARRIGFIVPRGNPKGIVEFRDLARNDVSIVNRVKGSGIRTYIDIELKKLASNINVNFKELTSRIRGYTYEVKTHTAVAAAVAQGRADTGITVEIAAEMYNLDFIPLTEEIVDFLIRKDRLRKETVNKFINLLKTEETYKLIKEIKGYKPLPETGEIIHEKQ